MRRPSSLLPARAAARAGRAAGELLPAAVLAMALLPGPLSAQPIPPPIVREPAQTIQVAPLTPVPAPGVAGAPGPVEAPEPAEPQPVDLSLTIAGSTRPIRAGIVWRIFADKGGGVLEPVDKLSDPTPTAKLPPGTYLVHAAYGLAGATKRITVGSAPSSQRLTIAAGALRLSGVIEGVPIPPEKLSFSVYMPIGADSEGRLIAAGVKPGDLVRLPEGTYHVVSTYGESNAILRTDLKVDRGQITDATLNHRAATVTLKLVAQEGSEAFAGTAFSVLTPGGDVIREAIGAFPRVTLAEGDYVLIARQAGKVYTREFKVESGLDRDVEVLVTPG